jgi:hypothetical protein
MKNYAKYRFAMLFLIDVLSAVFAIVVGGLLIQASVFPYKIENTEALATVGQPKISSARADMDIDEEYENLNDFYVQVVEDMLKGRLVMEKLLVTMSGSLLIVFFVVLAWNGVEIGLILKNKQNLNNKRNMKNSPTDLKNSPNAIETEDETCEEDEPSPSAKGDPEKGLMKSISI